MPPLKCKPETPLITCKKHREYEVADTMLNGLANIQACTDVAHPLVLSEANV